LADSSTIPRKFLRFFFYLLYQPFAWSYDLVAWVVSLGRWESWLRTTLPYLPGPRVLELGHGPGHLQAAVNSANVVAFGIDASAQMGRLARSRGALRLARAAAPALPLRAGSFDQIVATFPTEYILQPRTLQASKRLLAPGGQLVILPVAWLRGRSLPERAMAALFRITGQATDWGGSFTAHIRAAGFDVTEQRVQLHGSEVMLLVCHPRN
jgi:ubiquinone/menaquinone biosynthesis C-methylase UbiE